MSAAERLPAGFWWGCVVNVLCLSGHQIGVLIPGYLAERGLQRWEIGLADGVFWLAALLVQPWIGPRLDREGPRRYLIGGALAMSALVLVYAAAPVRLGTVLPLRAAQGAAMAVYLTAAWTWAASLGRDEQLVRVFGYYGISGLLPNAIGPGLGEAAQAAGGYPAVWIVAAALELAAAALAVGMVDAGAGGRAERAAGAREPGPEFLTALRSPQLASAVVTALCFGVLTGSLTTFLGPFLLVVGLAGIAAYWAVYTAFSVAVRIGGMSLAERLGPERLIVVPVLLMAAGVLMVSQVEARGWLAIPLLLLGASTTGTGHGMLVPAFNALAVRRLGPAARGTALAIVSAAVNLGGALGNPTTGAIAQVAGYRTMYAVVAAGAVVTAMVFPVLERAGRNAAALAVMLLLVAPVHAQRIALLSDVEGSAKKLERFLARHPAFETGADGRRHLARDAWFVHDGDVPDRFAGSARVVDELLRLKREAPERVVLIAGNRDVNKLRLLPELTPAALGMDPPVRPADWREWLTVRVTASLGRPPTPEELKRATTRAMRLRWIFARTMGAPEAFELRRRDLPGGATDDMVVDSFVADASPGGRFRALLGESRLLARVGPTLFCHAGLTDENLGLIPEQAGRAADVDAWIAGLDRWYRAHLARWDETAAAWNGRGPRPADALVRYVEPTESGTPNQGSVVYSRNADREGKIVLPSPAVIAWLRTSGIRRLCIGHTPSGEVPLPLRTEDDAFEMLVVDNSYAPDSELPAWVSLEGDAVVVRASLMLAGARREIAYRARLGHPTRLGKRLADGQVLVAPVKEGWIGFQMEPGWKVVYQLLPEPPAAGPGLELLAP